MTTHLVMGRFIVSTPTCHSLWQGTTIIYFIMFCTQQGCTLPFTSKLKSMHAHPPIEPKSKGFYLKHSNRYFVLVIQNTHAIYIWLVPIFICEWTLLNNKIVFPTILFIVQWIKHVQTNPFLHALSSFSPNLFMCVVWGIQVHKPLSLVSQSILNM
jgi:hypothetical protein